MADDTNPTPEAPQGSANHHPEPKTTASSVPEGADVTPQPEATPKPTPTPSRNYEAERKQERINKLTAQKSALEAELASVKASQSADATKVQQEINTKANALAEERAKQIAADQALVTSVNAMVEEGKKEFGEDKFNKATEALRALHMDNDPDNHQRYLNMIQAALDTGAGAKVIFALGDDTNEAHRIMGLSPTKMGVELGKLAFKDVEAVSGAPKPITPISGVGRNHVAIAAEDPERADGLDIQVWMERRNKHVGDVNGRAGRRIIP